MEELSPLGNTFIVIGALSLAYSGVRFVEELMTMIRFSRPRREPVEIIIHDALVNVIRCYLEKDDPKLMQALKRFYGIYLGPLKSANKFTTSPIYFKNSARNIRWRLSLKSNDNSIGQDG
jgi:hypothetical protein